MIDGFDPFLHDLVSSGYRLALHLYVSSGKRNIVINATSPDNSQVVTGRSHDGRWAEAVNDLKSEFDGPAPLETPW